MRLQQPVPFGPFMRQSSTFALIACRASQHKIIRTIRTATRQRANMVNMKDMRTVRILFKLLRTPIALAFLPLVLFLNIFFGISSLCLQCKSATLAIIDSSQVRMSFPEELIIRLKSITSFFTAAACLFSCYLWMPFVISSENSLTHFPMAFTNFKPLRVKVLRRIALVVAYLTGSIYTVFARFLGIEILHSGLFEFLANKAPLVTIWQLFSFFSVLGISYTLFSAYAIFTVPSQFVARFFVCIEKRTCGGFPFLALGTLLAGRVVLRYHVHDEGHSLSGSGCLQQRGASSCLIPQLYHKPASQASLHERS